jgi:hypothetical protein
MKAQIDFTDLKKTIDKLVSEKDNEINLWSNKYTILKTDYDKQNKSLTFYRTAFNVTLSIDFFSIVAGGFFVGGYYLANISR